MSAKGIGALAGLPVELYMVYDTETETYWSNSKGKSVWANQGHAKNAWCVGNRGTFNKQTRYVIHAYQSKGWERANSQTVLDLGQP